MPTDLILYRVRIEIAGDPRCHSGRLENRPNLWVT